MYSEHKCSNSGRNSTVYPNAGECHSIIASFAAPRPPTVTVTPLYGCGYLLEIKSQAKMGVGCDSIYAFHTTSLCHMCFYFLLFLLLQKVCFCYLCMQTVRLLSHANVHIHNMGLSNPPVYVLMNVNVSRHNTCLPPL